MNPPVFISNLIAMHSSEHYSFTEEELDFIINYDIKSPMGLGGGVAGEEAEKRGSSWTRVCWWPPRGRGWVPALPSCVTSRPPPSSFVSQELKPVMEANRLLTASPFAYGNPSRPTRESCNRRNAMVLKYGSEKYVPHVDPGSAVAQCLSVGTDSGNEVNQG